MSDADPTAAIAAAQAQAQMIAEKLVQESAPAGGEEPNGEEYNNKRKFEADEEAAADESAPLRKRASFNGPDEGGINGAYQEAAAAYAGDENPAAEVAAADPAAAGAAGGQEVIDVPSALVGKLIGRQGATIQDLQARSRTRIQVDHKTPGEFKKVTISGEPQDVVAAQQMIKEVLDSEGPTGTVQGDTTKSVSCPHGIVGRIIGKGGETIRSLQQASGAHIVVNQDFPEGVDRVVDVTGRTDAVERAVNMIKDLIGGSPGSAQAVIQKYGIGVTQYMECAKSMVGRIIGKSGETIKNVQKQSGANVQIDQTTDPCKITITGKREAVEQARHMVNDIISGNSTGFGGGFDGGPGGAPYGRPGFGQQPGYGQFPPGAPGGYGGYPYGGPPAPAPGYGGYGYGAPQYPPAYPAAAPAQQQYGGYGGYGAQDPYQQAGGGGYGGGAAYGGAGGGAAPAAAASVWQEQHDDAGRPYYYNTQTGQSQWEKPAEMQ